MKTKNMNKEIKTASLLMLAGMMLMITAPLAFAADDIIPDAPQNVAAADTEAPSDVENVKATAGDKEVTLTYNVATDNVGVKGYKIYYGPKPVVNDGDVYEKTVDAGNKIKYAVTDLINGTKYYFSVTAYDAAGNESTNYSLEVSATPAHGAADTEAPKVVKAESVYKDTVKVTFSKAVVLPSTNAQSAFSIKNDSSQAILPVRGATLDPADSSNKTVLLTTGTQQAGASYLLTAGIQVKDLSGNPIVSGTSDTGIFTGTDLEHPAGTTGTTGTTGTSGTSSTTAEADTKGPELTKVTVIDPTHVEVVFNEEIKLSSDPTQNFIITEEKNFENLLAVKSVQLGSDGKTVTLVTDPLQPMNYNLIAVEVKDKAGNTISVDTSATVFMGSAGSETGSGTGTAGGTQGSGQQTGSDTTAPEDATNFMAKLVDALAKLSWDPSQNSQGDLANYVIYQSQDGEVYNQVETVGAEQTGFDFTDLVPGMKYFFKLTTKDTAGNESQGVITTLTLPATGPELLLLALGSLGLGKLLKKNKNKRK